MRLCGGGAASSLHIYIYIGVVELEMRHPLRCAQVGARARARVCLVITVYWWSLEWKIFNLRLNIHTCAAFESIYVCVLATDEKRDIFVREGMSKVDYIRVRFICAFVWMNSLAFHTTLPPHRQEEGNFDVVDWDWDCRFFCLSAFPI